MEVFSLEARQQSALMLAFCALSIYVGGRILTGAIVAPRESAFRRSLGQWIPIAITALLAVALREPIAAVGVIFATSVGSLSLVTGIVGLYRSDDLIPSPKLRFGLLMIPAVVLTWLCGFQSRFSTWHAVLFLFEGVLIAWAWRSPSVEQSEPSRDSEVRATNSRGIEIVLAVLVVGLGAWAGVRGSVGSAGDAHMVPAGVLAVTFLSPMLLLPVIGASPILAQQGRGRDAMLQQAIVVMLNLLVLLPITIIAWDIRGSLIPSAPPALSTNQTVPASAPSTTLSTTRESTSSALPPLSTTNPLPTSAPSTEPSTTRASAPIEPEVTPALTGLPYPATIWRIDAVLLVILSLALAPALLQRWKLGTIESMMLVALYCAYIIMTTIASIR